MAARRIIWYAIACSTLLYGILAYATERKVSLQPIWSALGRPVVIGLYAVAIAIFIVAFALFRGDSPATGSFVIQLALFESVAILGLCAVFVMHDWRLYLPLWALALIGFSRTRPADGGSVAP